MVNVVAYRLIPGEMIEVDSISRGGFMWKIEVFQFHVGHGTHAVGQVLPAIQEE